MLDLELGLLWGDLIAGTNERAEGVVLVFLGYSPAVHAAEEVMRVASRAKRLRASYERTYYTYILSQQRSCCLRNTFERLDKDDDAFFHRN